MSIFTKRQISLTAAFLGVALFAGAALADLALGSGYQQLKDSVKQTAGSLLTMQDYTLTAQVELIEDNTTLIEVLTQYSMDAETGLSARYNRDQHNQSDGERISVSESSSYDDLRNGERISWNSHDLSVTGQVYYKSNIGVRGHGALITADPFDEPMAQDLEKVFDALVGSLSNLVQVSSSGEGKEFSGTLNEAQIPLVIQALVSYASKEASGAYDRDVMSSSMNLLPFSKEARVDKVVGWARTDAEGCIRDLSFELVLAGSDVQGTAHQLRALLRFTLDQIGTTTLVIPDLDEQQVIENQNYVQESDQVMPNYMSGDYHADIVLNQGNKLVKVGERHLSLSVDAEEARGIYREVWLPGYEEYAADSIDELEFSVGNMYTAMSYTSSRSVFGVSFGSSGLTYDRGGDFSAIDGKGREWSGYLNLHSSTGTMDLYLNGAVDADIIFMPLQRVFQ